MRPTGPLASDVDAADVDACRTSGCGRGAEHVDELGLAVAADAGDADDLARPDAEGDLVEASHAVELEREVAQLEHRRRAGRHIVRWRSFGFVDLGAERRRHHLIGGVDVADHQLGEAGRGRACRSAVSSRSDHGAAP